MKELYSFYVSKEKEVEVERDTPEGKLISKEVKSVPHRVILKKPSRVEMQQAELVYSKEWSLAVKEGILPKAVLTKMYADFGGTVSKEDSEAYIKLLEEYTSLQNDMQSLKFKNINDDNEECKVKMDDLTKRMIAIFTEIQDFESRQGRAYDQCAEVRARNKTIQWLVLFLTYLEDEKGEPQPFFKGRTDNEKADSYFQMLEDEDEFSDKVIDKSVLTISFWYLGRAETKEDFEQLEKAAEERSE